jgi:hypothetical protein
MPVGVRLRRGRSRRELLGCRDDRSVVRALVVVCMAAVGCSHAAAPAQVSMRTPKVDTRSWLERTGPRTLVKDVPNVDVTVTRREGPTSIDRALRILTVIATRCYSDDIEGTPLAIFNPEPRDVPMTVTIETRADGTMSEVRFEPENAPLNVAMCLTHALAAQPLHTERVPKRLVLAIDAHVTWSVR